jgi:hypothetical protein
MELFIMHCIRHRKETAEALLARIYLNAQVYNVSVYNADGSFSGPAEVNGIIQGGQNPVQQALMVSITNYLIRSNIQGRVYGDIKFDKGFTLHSEVNGRFNWGQAKIFRVFVENSI